jgi:uridine phosphorylase
MLKELERVDWMAMLDLAEDEIPEVVVLRGTRNLRRHYLAYAERFTAVRELGSPNGMFEDVLVGRYGDRQIGFASVYGPAMASEITHLFGKLGTRAVIQTGVCGGLAPDLVAGSLVIATSAGCGDGAVVCYIPDCASAPASDRLVELARTFLGDSQALFGPIWTTAALLAESVDDIERWAHAGYTAVDMETATTYGVAAWAGMEAISVLSVFDNPRDGAHIGLVETEKHHLRDAGEARVLDLVLHLVANA